MSRLFITPRELNFFSDITKEVIKDCIGQKIVYYPISEVKTQNHPLYNESIKKVFDNPIEIDCLVSSPEITQEVSSFTVDNKASIEVYLHMRDLIDKKINVSLGDFFSYGGIMFEIVKSVLIRNIHGLSEHWDGMNITGAKARESAFKVNQIHGPTNYENTDADAVQKTFVQQRGYTDNKLGQTEDVRDLRRNDVLDDPITGQKEISSLGDPNGIGSAFYDEED